MSFLSPEQCRAARGWLGMTQPDLVKGTHVSRITVHDFEKSSREAKPRTVMTLQAKLEQHGLRLTFDRAGLATGFIVRGHVEDRARRNTNLTPEQCRAARRWIDWSQLKFAEHFALSVTALRDFEQQRLRRDRESFLRPETIKALIATFNAQGVHFLFNAEDEAIGIEYIEPVRQRNVA